MTVSWYIAICDVSWHPTWFVWNIWGPSHGLISHKNNWYAMLLKYAAITPDQDEENPANDYFKSVWSENENLNIFTWFYLWCHHWYRCNLDAERWQAHYLSLGWASLLSHMSIKINWCVTSIALQLIHMKTYYHTELTIQSISSYGHQILLL